MSVVDRNSHRTSIRLHTPLTFGMIAINLIAGLLLPSLTPLTLIASSAVLVWLIWRAEKLPAGDDAAHDRKLLEISLEMASHLSLHSDLPTVVQTISASASALFETPQVWLVDDGSDNRHVSFLTAEPPDRDPVQQCAQAALTSGKLHVAQDGVTTTVCTPLLRQGSRREVLCLQYPQAYQPTPRELERLDRFGVLVARHLDNARLYEASIAAHNRIQALLNSTRDGVLMLDRDGVLIECNPSAERMLGIDRESFLGKPLVTMLFQLMEVNEVNGLGYSRSQLTNLARQLRTEPERITRRQFERGSRPQVAYIEEIGSPLVDSSQQIVGRLLIMRDITEQKLLTEFREEIMSMAVHDLRGPLAAIISGLTFAIDEMEAGSDPVLLTTTLNWSLESANSLMRLVESLLDINKLENRQMPLERVSINAQVLVDAAYRALANTINAAQIQFNLEIDPSLPDLLADEEMLRRVLINLLDNAIRFTPSGERVRLTVGFAPNAPGKALFCMADSGPGVPNDERERIFERFRQIKVNAPLRGSKGSGLGLTFCKLAVEAHGGTIWVEKDSTLPGACFAFTVPLVSRSESKGE